MVRFPEGALTNSDKALCRRHNRICDTERAAYSLSPSLWIDTSHQQYG
jgi:hypothetical protein